VQPQRNTNLHSSINAIKFILSKSRVSTRELCISCVSIWKISQSNSLFILNPVKNNLGLKGLNYYIIKEEYAICRTLKKNLREYFEYLSHRLTYRLKAHYVIMTKNI